MSHYIATGAVMVGLPLWLFKQSMSSVEDNEIIDEKDRKMPRLTYMKIQRKGLLTRIFVSSTCYAAIMSLYFYKYPNTAITRFIALTIIDQWKWKMIEMTMSGKEFFTKKNIKKSWQAILSGNITVARIDFNKINISNTRQTAFLYLMESLGMAAFLYYMHNKSGKNVDKYAVKVAENMLPIFTGLILGDIINIRYCYYRPFLALNWRQFWKRWSIHIGEPLRNYVYIPFGGNKNPIISSLMVFIVNGLDHIGFAAILNEFKYDPNYISIAKVFAVVGGGTILDGLLYSYFVKPKKEKSIFVSGLRFLLMYSTFIAQAIVQ